MSPVHLIAHRNWWTEPYVGDRRLRWHLWTPGMTTTCRPTHYDILRLEANVYPPSRLKRIAVPMCCRTMIALLVPELLGLLDLCRIGVLPLNTPMCTRFLIVVFRRWSRAYADDVRSNSSTSIAVTQLSSVISD